MKEIIMNKQEMTSAFSAAKEKSGMTWEQIATASNMSPVWTTSACLGMNSMSEDKARALCETLALGDDVAKALQVCPHKHWVLLVLSVLLVYRFFVLFF